MKFKFIMSAMAINALLTPLASATTLTYTVYTNETEFTEAAELLSANDFEAIPSGTDCKNYNFGDFETDGRELYVVSIEDANTHVLHFNSSSYTQNMSLFFHNPIVAFGFDWCNTDNNDDMVRVDFDGTRYVLGAKDETGFWGVVATEGWITSDTPFLFGDTPGGAGWSEGYLDNIRYAKCEVLITNIQFSGTNMILEWSGNQSNLLYAVESCSDLNSNLWSFSQTTSQCWTTDTIWTNTQDISKPQFFRIKAKLQ